MSDEDFINKIILVAEELKDEELTFLEKSMLITYFNESNGTAYEKARIAIEKTVQKRLPDSKVIEKAASSLNHIKVLLSQLNTSARNWEKEKK